MLRDSPVSYAKKLQELIVSAEVTDRSGGKIASDNACSSIVQRFLSLRSSRNKVIMTGNGGSLAIVSHMHNDLTKAVGVRGMVFNEPPLFSALANDCGYGSVFEYPLNLWAEPQDVLVAISSSGRSESILRAADLARERGCWIITFSGFAEGNPLRSKGDINYFIASGEYGYVEMAHQVLVHYLTDMALFALPKQS